MLMKKIPSFTIVVPAFNEEEMIADCITSIQQQDYAGEFEIIVVDNASTDRTGDIARSMGVTVVAERKQGYVHALRAGFSAATGTIIACTDADTRVPQFWLSQISENLSKTGTVACSGVFMFYDGPLFIRFIGKAFGKFNYHLAGANMAVWRSVYLASGGFDPHVNMGADVELGQRLGKFGHVLIDRSLVARTSGRRFQYAFFQTLALYYLNDLSLLLLRRPLFYNFPNIRARSAKLALASTRSAYARIAIAGLVLACFLWISENTENRLFGSVLAHGQQNLPLVALTFDDGPSKYTPQILDTLAKYNVKATFFMIGNNVDRYPDIARRVTAEGHAIGNHTYSHPFWAPMEMPRRLHGELSRAENSIFRATEQRPAYFRPPHGWRSPWMMQLARKENYTVVTWTVSPDDWQHISRKVIEHRVLSKCAAGSIVLMHDGIELKQDPQRQETVAALPVIITELKSRGYRFVTIPELISSSEQTGPKSFAQFSSAPTPEE
jgi:peptidoglycan/xylan/chitin deacetylase (PgdA/CDA1 family)